VKLGGWHRLWLVTSVVYLLAVAVFTASTAPTAETVKHRTEFYERMGESSISVLTAALDTQNLIRVQAENGHEIPFAASTPKETMQAILRQYHEALEAQAASERLPFFGRAFLWWLVPVVALYVAGAAVGWVYRGFRTS
jgi:hypothetical protein